MILKDHKSPKFEIIETQNLIDLTDLIFQSFAPLYILLTKMYAFSINTSFFTVQLRLKDSEVVVRWSHTPKVPG